MMNIQEGLYNITIEQSLIQHGEVNAGENDTAVLEVGAVEDENDEEYVEE